MKIHEYQAKEILRRYGVITPRGQVTDDPAEAGRIASELGGRAVVKAQIHAGGRGKGGGVKVGKTPEEVQGHAANILGMLLVTPQTGPEGQKVRKVLIEEALDIVNDSKFGLQAGIFTRDLFKMFDAWDRLDVGGVVINDVPSYRVDNMPYGGVKDSGLGREGIRFAMEDMTEIRNLVIRRGS